MMILLACLRVPLTFTFSEKKGCLCSPCIIFECFTLEAELTFQHIGAAGHGNTTDCAQISAAEVGVVVQQVVHAHAHVQGHVVAQGNVPAQASVDQGVGRQLADAAHAVFVDGVGGVAEAAGGVQGGGAGGPQAGAIDGVGTHVMARRISNARCLC